MSVSYKPSQVRKDLSGSEVSALAANDHERYRVEASAAAIIAYLAQYGDTWREFDIADLGAKAAADVLKVIQTYQILLVVRTEQTLFYIQLLIDAEYITYRQAGQTYLMNPTQKFIDFCGKHLGM